MKSAGSYMAALGLLAAGCSGNYSPANPLAASLAPAVAACPARYSFESDSEMPGWYAPSWPGGFVGLARDSSHAQCGNSSLRLRVNLTAGAGKKLVVLQRLFPATQALSAATRSLGVYFDQAPPASLRIIAVFVGQDLMWKSPAPDNKSAFTAGWNLMSGTISTPQAAGLLFQIEMTGSVAWSGDLWIDDINW